MITGGAPGRFEVGYLVPDGAVRGTVLESAADALLRTALHDFEGPR